MPQGHTLARVESRVSSVSLSCDRLGTGGTKGGREGLKGEGKNVLRVPGAVTVHSAAY